MQLEASKPERALKKVKRGLKAVDQARHIIKKLLRYSRKNTERLEEVNVNEVVTETIDFVGHYLDRGDFEVSTELQPVGPVAGRAQELQQVLVNLILNAIDASDELEPNQRRVRLATAQEGEFVTLSVEDWGRGMTPEQLERAFDPFYTTKEVGEGTGLGLSVSQQIVSQHNGALTAESTPGQGTTFTLRLPITSESL